MPGIVCGFWEYNLSFYYICVASILLLDISQLLDKSWDLDLTARDLTTGFRKDS